MIRSGFMNVIGSVLKSLIALSSIPILINQIGLANYGTWIWTYTIILSASVFDLGQNFSLIYYISKEGENDKKEIGTSLAISIITFSIISLIIIIVINQSATNIANLLNNKESVNNIAQLLKLGSFVMCFRFFQSVGWSCLIAQHKFKIYNILYTSHSFLMYSLWIIVSIIETSALLYSLMTVTLFVDFIVLLLLIIKNNNIVKNLAYVRLIDIKSKFRPFIKYSLHSWGGTISTTLYSQSDKLIMGSILGPSAVGIYSTIISITAQINTLSAQIVSPIFPLISSHKDTLLNNNQSNPNFNRLLQIVKESMSLNFIVAMGLGGIVIITSPILIFYIFGSSFKNEYILYAKLAAIIYTYYSISAVGYYLLFAINKSIVATRILLIGSIVSIIGITLGSKYFGIMGGVLGNIGNIIVVLMLKKGLELSSLVSKISILDYIYPIISFHVVILISFYIDSFPPIFLLLLVYIIYILYELNKFINIKSKFNMLAP